MCTHDRHCDGREGPLAWYIYPLTTSKATQESNGTRTSCFSIILTHIHSFFLCLPCSLVRPVWPVNLFVRLADISASFDRSRSPWSGSRFQVNSAGRFSLVNISTFVPSILHSTNPFPSHEVSLHTFKMFRTIMSIVLVKLLFVVSDVVQAAHGEHMKRGKERRLIVETYKCTDLRYRL